MGDPTIGRRIPILVYADIEAGAQHLVDVFGLGPAELVRDGEGNVVHGEVEAGDGVIWMHLESPDFGLASPRTLGAATGMITVFVDDVDAHFENARDRGATIRYEPTDQPYGVREYGAVDPEGFLWSFMTPID